MEHDNIAAPLADPEPGTANQPKDAMLNLLEARILGALMEKQLTTPDTYPLSLNSLILACNQKTSREPVMKLQQGEVQHCLNLLQEKKLIDIEYASRANKYSQRLTRTLHFNKAEQAIFCLMLLRGPQTINELITRSKRLYEFKNHQELNELTETHLGKFKPLIMKTPNQTGQREDRYTHLLCGEPDLSPSAMSETAQRKSQYTEGLEIRVSKLEQQVAFLMEQLGID